MWWFYGFVCFKIIIVKFWKFVDFECMLIIVLCEVLRFWYVRFVKDDREFGFYILRNDESGFEIFVDVF